MNFVQGAVRGGASVARPRSQRDIFQGFFSFQRSGWESRRVTGRLCLGIVFGGRSSCRFHGSRRIPRNPSALVCPGARSPYIILEVNWLNAFAMFPGFPERNNTLESTVRGLGTGYARPDLLDYATFPELGIER